VPDDTSVCPNCGGREFTDRWDGVVAVLDPQNSKVASLLGIKKSGMYAIKVRTRTHFKRRLGRPSLQWSGAGFTSSFASSQFSSSISSRSIPSHLSSGQFYSLTDLRRDADLLPAMKGKVFALETFIYKGLLKQLSR